MRGRHVVAARNPGIRVEPDFVSEAEEEQLIEELLSVAKSCGYKHSIPQEEDSDSEEWLEMPDGVFKATEDGMWEHMDDDDDEWEDDDHLIRVTGRNEGQGSSALAPWGHGPRFDAERLPPALAKVVARIEGLAGYPLGPLRDVTVNIRRSVDYEMCPHVDPPTDGANSFVLSLLAEAVITFSPVRALRQAGERAKDEHVYVLESFTDEDLDCRVARRGLYHTSGDARYHWTHAIRPPRETVEDDAVKAYDRWGCWDEDGTLERPDDRVAVIFSFADPWNVPSH